MTATPTDTPFKRVESIDTLDVTRLNALTNDSGTVVTIALPMETAGAETRKNRIRFKNALTAALDAVEAANAGLRAPLEALDQLDREDHDFWQHQTEGLMIKVTENGSHAYQLPFAPEETVRVASRFYTFPLMPLLSKKRGYLLALDLNELKLYRVGGYGDRLTELPLHEEIPTSLAEAMKYDDPEESLQFHSTATGGGAAVYHGHGRAGDEANDKKKIKRFFEMVDKHLADSLPDREAPLFLAGPPHEVGIFREVNSYPHLEEDFLEINTAVDQMDGDSLQNRVADWFSEKERPALESAREKTQAAIGNRGGSTDLEELIPLATEGRIDTLLIRDHAQARGFLDAETRKVRWDDEGDDLTDLLTFRAATTGAEVHIVDQDDPAFASDACAAAALRY